MPNGEVEMLFFDDWSWLIFVAVGLVLIMLELLVGIDTGLDLVFIGSALVLGGVVTLALNSWVWTAVASGVICLVYVGIGRRYVHRRVSVAATKTNIDTIVGKTGFVEKDIVPGRAGLVRVANEQWRARADQNIPEGESISVTGIDGVTLTVVKAERGHS